MPKVKPQSWHLIPESGENGLRLDCFVAAHTGMSRGMARRLLDLGGVHGAGQRVRRCSRPVAGGETVDVYLDGRPLDIFSLKPEQILFRDMWLLAVNKPSGVEVNPTPARYQGTLYEALLRFLRESKTTHPELGMVQRLDRDTSGVLIFSIHRRAHKNLTLCFQEHRVTKVYRLLASGCFETPEGEFRSQLARRGSSNRMGTVASGGREAITRFRVLRQYEKAAYVEAHIPTGRSHQIRVHFAENGHPVLGDAKYGNAASASRLMLHALRLELPHPVTGRPLVVEAPLPDDMASWLCAHDVS